MKLPTRLNAILPYDAWCLSQDSDDLAVIVRQFINKHRWQPFPAALRFPLKLGIRVLWLAWCPYRILRISQKTKQQIFTKKSWHTLKNCYHHGHKPIEILAPQLALTSLSTSDVGNLRDNHWILLWKILGNASSLRLAQDKLALAEHLSAMGLSTPPLLCELPQGSKFTLEDLPRTDCDRLFIKPRHGSQAIGAFSLKRIANDCWQINGNQKIDGKSLQHQIDRLLQMDSLLVQPFLRPLTQLAELSSDAPLELRITTAHLPDGQSFIHSAYLKIQAPGTHASTAISGALAAPIAPGSGMMQYGIQLQQPHLKLKQIPWSGVALHDRILPHYPEVEAMVLTASRALPGIPVLGWDVLLTENGPVILEANTGLSWRLMHLSHALTGEPSRLPQVIREWMKISPSVPTVQIERQHSSRDGSDGRDAGI